jgi:hypothetical protein
MTNLSDSTVRFQTDRETVEAKLTEIGVEWLAQGIETPVVDETGEIDPDAELELLDRLP